MGAAASIALRLPPSMCSAAAAVCPPVGVAAGVFGAGMALGAAAAVCPPVGIAAVFGAGVALGAAFRVKATHAVATDLAALDAVVSAASEAATGSLRAVKNAACSALECATKRFARPPCHGGTAENKKEPPAAAASSAKKRERETDHHRAAQLEGLHHDFLAVLSDEAASFDVACSCSCLGGNGNAPPSPWDEDDPAVFPATRADPWAPASQLLATRAAWRASQVMAALESLKPLEEELGASIPREAKSCICVMAAAAGVCLDVFKPPTPSGRPWLGMAQWSAEARRRGGRIAAPLPRSFQWQ